MRSSHGHFAADGTEFVVTERNTPRAWVNYFWNDRFISGVSQHGSGEGMYKERAMQYIDPRGRNLMIRDGDRCFYLRDESDGAVWSPGWYPVRADVENFRCTHGLGYSVIESARAGIAARFRVFVPPEAPCEIWTVTLTSRRDAPATIKLYSFADWLLQGYPIYSDYYSSLRGEYHDDVHVAQGCNRSVERTHDVFDGFVASDVEPTGFDTSRRAFLGNFGHVALPEAVAEGRCRNSLACSEKLISALEHTLTIPPGGQRTLHVLIGASSGREMTREIVTRLTADGVIESEFERLRARKGEMIDCVRVDTPDERTNWLVNGWIKQQIQLYADVGSDNGRGFRDAMQLLWATASFDSAYTRRMLDECLRHQFADGHTLRGWLPVDDHHYSDGPVWIAPVVDAYLRETGDADVLDAVVRYFDEGAGSVWDHLLRGLHHSTEDLGPRGLVRAHFGDWNDSLTGVGVEGRGESVWTTIAIIYSCKVAARIARLVRGRTDEADELLARAERLRQAVETHAWDGQWYLRAINDRDEPVGSRTNRQGRIWLLPQVWAILADIVDDERRALLLRMVDEHLECDYGSLVQSPPYAEPDAGVGRLTMFNPGMWENGCPYCHATSFKIIADCVAGRGDEAYRSFCKVMPDNQWNPSTHSGCEPYVVTNMYLGPDHPRAGETQFAWMTGASGWMYRAMTEWILGVRADYEGLLVDPCLPREWTRCGLTRSFRDARYDVTILNPHGLCKAGRVALTVDGEPIEGGKAPIFADGETHAVRAEMLPG